MFSDAGSDPIPESVSFSVSDVPSDSSPLSSLERCRFSSHGVSTVSNCRSSESLWEGDVLLDSDRSHCFPYFLITYRVAVQI